jgi:hypothetical protein
MIRALFVTPSLVGSGEAVTAAAMARDLVRCGGEVAFLASPATAPLLAGAGPDDPIELGHELLRNRALWDDLLATFDPTAVVFADYALLFFEGATPPLADDDWAASLGDIEAAMVTLDHVGYAQRAQLVFFGPPHLSTHATAIPDLPAAMEVLLPCPINEPGPVEGRLGTPFQYLASPTRPSKAERDVVRERYLGPGRDTLVLHAAPAWAASIAAQLGLPYFEFWPALVDEQLGDAADRVTVVSVNHGELLPTGKSRVRVVNQAPLPPEDFDALLLSADLLVTENKISTTLGRAVLASVPSVHFANPHRLGEVLHQPPNPIREIALEMARQMPGAVYPWEVFPIWSRADLEELGVFRNNTFAATFKTCAVFDATEGRACLGSFITDEAARAELASEQERYAAAAARLPTPAAVLEVIT